MERASEPTSEPRIASVMVVGGGVGGIQASLDLAESGFKVYLVEAKSAIGGHMAQLDKTFPTNDCAMCTLAPRLVEAGRHLNIEILTDTEVMDLQGAPGNFRARLRRKARYVDVTKCIGCGDCEKVCPIVLPDPYNENLSSRRAAHRLYPQAIPSAYAIAKRGIAPCRNACPANTSAQGYLALIKARRYDDALEVIKQYNPFPGTVGRVCSHPCETQCSRGQVDEPVAICALKRFVADRQAGTPVIAPERKYAEEIAIVGSGPAGLSCGHHLARLGYKSTVFEALPVAGGMMRVGIPAYRLPRDVLDREIDDIRQEGVEIRLNHPVHNLHDLFQQNYKAIFLAVGAHQPQELGIPGEHGTIGVHYGVAFLRRVSLGEKVELGERVVVVGGGKTAIDAARTALRVGAKNVTLLYRRTRAEMPAFPHEVQAGEAEGMKLELLSAPIEVLHDGGHLRGVRCIRMQLGAPDASGRRRPVPIPGSEFEIEADALIPAVAQAPELSLLSPDHGVSVSRDGWFQVDPVTLATNIPGIFAGGDAAQGPGMLIDAVAAGRRGALSIHRHLRGLPLLSARDEQPLPVGRWTETELEARLAHGEIVRGQRAQAVMERVEDRITDFREVETSLTEDQAVAEAERCLACGLCAECYQCVKACGVNAIVHEMVERVEDLAVGAVILAPGVEPLDLRGLEYRPEYGYGRYPNVVTSLEFERLLSATGPTGGVVKRPSDDARPRKIAWIQCVGSRDCARGQDYCSSICCMYAAKEAVIAREHDANIEPTIFYLDLRAYGKDFGRYVERAKSQGVRYIRSMVSAVERGADGGLKVRYALDDGPKVEEFDLVVLSVGVRPSAETQALAQRLGLKLGEHGFAEPVEFAPTATSRPGVFVAGPFREPKDIPETVIDASAAAGNAEALLAQARGTLARQREYPPEREMAQDAPRIGVFVCHCGSNIAGYLDVQAVAEYARTLPNVVHSETNLYTCSQDSIARITQTVQDHNLNRVVVAACTPRTHEPLFQNSIRAAGLNPYLFEMANIRNQCSWVHSHDRVTATAKAKDLVRSSVARVAQLEPLHKVDMALENAALVIGGGVAGMNAAVSLAEQGFPVHLIERTARLGGYAAEDGRFQLSDSGEHSQAALYVRDLVAHVRSHPRIHVHTCTELAATEGFVGNFTSHLRVRKPFARPDGDGWECASEPHVFTVRHGAIIVAVGAQEWRGAAYGYGRDPRIITQGELGERIARAESQNSRTPTLSPAAGRDVPDSVVFIQCVGPAEKYCGRTCCAESLESALRLKEVNPDARVTVLFKEMRTYGFHERTYTRARERGVLFIRYDDAHLPQLTMGNSHLSIAVWEPMLREELLLHADLVVVSAPMVPSDGARELANLLKVPVDQDGWFMEAHVKLRPVDFASDGIFVAGAAHYPKFMQEAIAQAQAAAARAATILSKPKMEVGGIVAVVDPEKCTGCLTCVRICPYNVPRINPAQVAVGAIKGAAEIPAAACHGCGICAAECPAKAIELMHFKDGQVLAKVEALFARDMVRA